MHDKTRVQLCDGQKLALSRLHGGIDILLVAKTGFGKTLIFIGFHLLLSASKRAITLIISPLIAIEQDMGIKSTFLPSHKCFGVGRGQRGGLVFCAELTAATLPGRTSGYITMNYWEFYR